MGVSLVQMMVTFDMTGVKKQDMHVSYRTNRLIVNWKVERTTEKQDGDGVVREREVKRYSHTIPLPEGTKVRAYKPPGLAALHRADRNLGASSKRFAHPGIVSG